MPSQHFVGYHNVDNEGPLDVDPGYTTRAWHTRHPYVIEKLRGDRLWAITGERVSGKKKYRLVETGIVDDITADGDQRRVHTRIDARPNVDVTNEPWFRELFTEQHNFSFGLRPIRSAAVIAALERLRASPTQAPDGDGSSGSWNDRESAVTAAASRRTGRSLAREWGVDAKHALYRDDGTWYHLLERFPAAYFDRSGYLRFETRKQYDDCPGAAFGKPPKNWASFADGIASVPGYVRVVSSSADDSPEPAAGDEIESAFEGEMHVLYVAHRTRERALRDAKIADAVSRHGKLACEVVGCGFDFSATYGTLGKDFAHVHHRIALSARGAGETRLDDLAIVCANCHAMIHVGGACRPLDAIAAARREAERRAE